MTYQKTYYKKWYEKNRERKKAEVRQYYKDCIDTIKVKNHLRYMEHREERTQYAREYRRKHKIV